MVEYLHNSGHELFNYETLEELREKMDQLGVELPFSDRISALFEPIYIHGRSLPNAWAVQPMEGCDASGAGAPEKLTVRRYRRFAAGGSGMLWMEATAVREEGRANPRQLMLNRENAETFRTLRDESMEAAQSSMGAEHRPLMIVQLTHSGRYSQPEGSPAPIIAHHSEYLDPKHDLPPDYPLITDEELDALKQDYIEAAAIASEIGFEAVDIKACHGYLLNQLLAAHTRENSKYGGSFENRTRFIREVVEAIRRQNPELILCTRLNVYDATPYPYGFGMAEDGSMEPDLCEPVRLIQELHKLGLDIVNVAVGNPYYNPHVERPFDTPVAGGYIPQEHPLENIAVNMEITREIGAQIPEEILTVASGLSWLRQFIPEVAGGLKEESWCDVVGLGRMAFAYPDFVRDLQDSGRLESGKMCICCSSCTQIMRDGGRSGCPVRDSEIYGPIYQEGRLRDQDYMSELAETCRNCAPASCREGCPADIDIPGFITAIARGEDELSYSILRDKNNLPEVCAYVCPVEALCEKECVQNAIGRGPVPIQDLQRYVSEAVRLRGASLLSLPEEIKQEQVAVVGAGPAGVGCTVDLVEKGYRVTIFDAAEEPGGMAREVIPEHRLKRNVFNEEVDAILADVPEERLKWRCTSHLESGDLSRICEEYDAVFIGTGLQAGIPLFTGDSRPDGVYDALDFLRKVKRGERPELREDIAVIGGGNTAMDVAVRAAEEAGTGQDVFLVYRRSFDQMPAWGDERQKALEAGVHFLILQQPVEYLADERGRLAAIRLIRTRLGDVDESGRRRPEVIPGTEQELAVGTVIEALGQRLETGLEEALVACGIVIEDGLIQTRDGGYETSREGVFAGGDVINGGMTVVRAVSDGGCAAEEIAGYLASDT